MEREDGNWEMSGITGYKKSWFIVQTSVDKLKTEIHVPVAPSQRKKRERRHFLRKRVYISMHRDLMVNKVIKKAQAFQLEYEETAEKPPARLEINTDPPVKPLRKRKDRHYEYAIKFQNLPPLSYLIPAAPEDTVEDLDDGECDLSTPLVFAIECKEDDENIFVPAPLSTEIDDELAKIYLSPMSLPPKENAVTKFLKKHGGPLMKLL